MDSGSTSLLLIACVHARDVLLQVKSNVRATCVYALFREVGQCFAELPEVCVYACIKVLQVVAVEQSVFSLICITSCVHRPPLLVL